MKWLVFGLALAGSVLFGLWLRRNQRHVPAVWSLAAFLPFVLTFDNSNIALVSWPWFPGYTYGLEVTFLDLVIISLRVALPPGRRHPPLRVVRAAYLIAVAVSMAQANFPMAAFFGVWQLLRMYLVFSVVARAAQDPRVAISVLKGLAGGVLLTSALAFVQRYLLGYHEVLGLFAHQNIIGLVCYFAIMPTFALLLMGRTSWLFVATPLAGALAVVLSLSRGSLLILVGGLGLTFLLSMRHLTWRKLMVGFGTFVVASAIFVKAYDQLEVRFSERTYGAFAAGEGLDERARLEVASRWMLEEHPFGVGANHHTWALHSGGYAERAKITARGSATGEIKVHNFFWLTATETGHLGLAAFLALALALLAMSFRGSWAAGAGARGQILLGLGVAMLLFLLHGLLEWIQILMNPQYVFWFSAGLAAGLTRGAPPPGRVPALAVRADRRVVRSTS